MLFRSRFLAFFGFIDTAASYTSITFGNTAPGTDVFGFDDLVIGDARQVSSGVPEPVTSLLVIPALAAMWIQRARLSQASSRV